jgi:hypothetical protein
MIRPLHYILNNKSLADITAPITGKVEELQAFASQQQSLAAKETEAAELAFQSAKLAHETARLRAANRLNDAAEASRVAAKLIKIVQA